MPFVKGQSGNPKGRRPGLKPRPVVRRELSKLTDQGRETAQFFVSVMKGRVAGAKVADRVKCAEWIAKWQFGCAPEVVPDNERGRDIEPEAPDGLAAILKFPVADPMESPATEGAGQEDP